MYVCSMLCIPLQHIYGLMYVSLQHMCVCMLCIFSAHVRFNVMYPFRQSTFVCYVSLQHMYVCVLCIPSAHVHLYVMYPFSTCTFGSWTCTKKACVKSCTVVGLEHITTFDGLSYKISCPEAHFTLVEVSILLKFKLAIMYIINLEPTLFQPSDASELANDIQISCRFCFTCKKILVSLANSEG